MSPELLVGGVIVVTLIVYSLTGGADFGGGLWDLLARGKRADAQRETIARTLGPIWEANHVWLIVVLVLLWTCFPKVFATIAIALHIPLTLTLVGIVLRGSAFVFRSYGPDDARTQRQWSLIFAMSSIVTPITFGMSVGAISSGALPMDPVTGRVQTDFFSAWAAPFPIVTGLYTLALFAWLAAVYLTNEVAESPLRRDFRLRALGSGTVAGLLAFWVLGLMPTGAPQLWALVSTEWVVWGFVGVVSLGAVGSLAATALRRRRISRALAAATVAGVVGGWGAAMFPSLVQPDLTLWNAAAPTNILWTTLGVLGVGSTILVPSFIFLYRVFRTGALGADPGLEAVRTDPGSTPPSDPAA